MLRRNENKMRLPWSIPGYVFSKYEFYSINHAVEVLSQAYPEEYAEMLKALDFFTLSISDILAGGGNESAIPKNFQLFCTHEDGTR